MARFSDVIRLVELCPATSRRNSNKNLPIKKNRKKKKERKKKGKKKREKKEKKKKGKKKRKKRAKSTKCIGWGDNVAKQAHTASLLLELELTTSLCVRK